MTLRNRTQAIGSGSGPTHTKELSIPKFGNHVSRKATSTIPHKIWRLRFKPKANPQFYLLPQRSAPSPTAVPFKHLSVQMSIGTLC